MITRYSDAIYQALVALIQTATPLAMPLAVCIGLAVVAAGIVLAVRRDAGWLERVDWRAPVLTVMRLITVVVIVVAGWSALGVVRPMAQQDLRWRDTAEATTHPIPSAPAIFQSGPALAALREHTYTRTLTLPPALVQRVGAEGVGVLAPYLSDPTAENVLRLVDTFRRSGQDVVFTRQVTRQDEEPIPFTGSQVSVKFQRLSSRAYDAAFEGRYSFQNLTDQPITARFMFTLPQAGTIRGLSVVVGDRAITDPDDTGAYQWKGPLAPGERREAVVRYQVVGGRAWHYRLGSERRRVQQFRLDAAPGGPVRFLRGSLQPAGNVTGALRWDLANVVTAQEVGIAFPSKIAGTEAYLQALSALPATFILFLVGMLAVGFGSRQLIGAGRLAGSLVLFAFGLGASAVLANYIGSVAGVIVGPLLGALLASALIGPRFAAAALPAALIPAAFLSPQHTGLLLLLLGVLSLPGLFLVMRPTTLRSPL